ncbi:hypothetical protein D6D28_02013 [Aureobasidium pullulans]|uniref:Uncharacterized protein n=2 Tax=Aureobasidium pullulans TaxID=5580 RepID=A0A4S8SVE8_AURPU|nr:hypothetical protein D6D28_02013 [Aureobasidium pullulans]
MPAISHMRILTPEAILPIPSTTIRTASNQRCAALGKPPNIAVSTQAPAHGRKAAVAIVRMPLSETELRLVEAMFENKRDVKAVLQVLPHAVVSTLYRQKKNYDTFGSIHKPETTKKRRLRKPVVADADPDPEASTTPSSSDSPPSRLSDTDRTVEMLFSQGCSVRVVQSWFPNRPKSSLYRMQHNLDVYGSVRKPETMWKKKGRPCSVTPEMKEWLVQLVKEGKEMWQRDLAYELFTKFGVFVSPSTISRLLKEQHISKRLGPVASTEIGEMGEEHEAEEEDTHEVEEEEEAFDIPITQDPNLDPFFQLAF